MAPLRRSLVGALLMTLSLVAPAGAATERLRRAIHEIPGVPAGATDVAQDEHGFIWISGTEGLARFDGVEARPWAPRVIPELLEYVTTGPGGSVCAGNTRGGLYEVVGQTAVPVRGRGGELRLVRHAAYDAAGRLWAIHDGRVQIRDRRGAWIVIAPDRLTREEPWRLAADSDGTVVVGTREGGLYRLAVERPALSIARGLGGPVARIVVEDGGAIVVSVRGRGVLRLHAGHIDTVLEERGRPTGLAGRGGAVWAVFTSAVYSIPVDGPPERLEADDGFASSGSVMVDRDGGLWLTSFRGVELYPEPSTVVWTEADGHERFRATSVVPGARGGIWVSSWNGPVFRRDGERAWKPLDTAGWWTAHEGCLDGQGRVWTSGWSPGATRTALLRWDAGSLAVSRVRDGATEVSCALRGDTLWMCYGRDLLRIAPGRDEPEIVASIPSTSDRPTGLASHPRLGMAATYGSELCTALDPEAAWRCESVPGVGSLTGVAVGPDGRWWLATDETRVVAHDRGAWLPVLPEGTIRDTRVVGLTPSPRGGLWVATSIEKVRIDRELRVIERLTRGNGLPTWLSGPVREQSDGTIWIATANGPLRMPGRARRESSEPPPLQITGLSVDGRSVATAEPLALPAGEHVVEARFSTFAYRDLEDLHYRLRSTRGQWAGVDSPVVRWVAPAAGRHGLELQASLDGTRWSRSATRFAFRVDRPWYATPWPWLGVLSIAGLLGYVWHRLRLAQLMRLERQRTAIAMDLHDEIGAAVGSIGIMAGVACDPEASEERRTAVAQRIAEAAEEVGATLHDILWSLRIRDARFDQLAAQLTERGSRLFPGDGTTFEARLPEDLPRNDLTLPVRRNVQRIVVEAMHNAARHASASRVELGFAASRECHIAWVEDDGVGVDHPSRNPGGHLGLRGMRRRAEEIGAQLEIVRGSRGGTRVELRFHADGTRVRKRATQRGRNALVRGEPEEAS